MIAIIAHMHNFIIEFGKILDIFKEFAGRRVDKNGNRPHCGVVPKFSDLEVIALSATAEALDLIVRTTCSNILTLRKKMPSQSDFPSPV